MEESDNTRAGLAPAPAERPGQAEPALDVRDLSIHFGGVAALSGVTLTVDRGGLTAVIGPNGAGKPTLFNCVSGLYRGEGEILLDGESVQGLSAAERARRGIARTFQPTAFVENMSVLDNVMLGCYRWTSAGVLETFVGLRRVRNEEREAREAAGLRAAARLAVPETDAFVGSDVVVLEAPR